MRPRVSLTMMFRGPGSDPAPPLAQPAVMADSRFRRAVDVAVAGAAILVMAPVFAAIAVVIKLDSKGPAFFVQERVGRDFRPFALIKFRSMIADADRCGPLVSGRADPRITRVGAWLRATKLDELPQLINVLDGDMTLVGPRPEVSRYLAHYDRQELSLLGVRPGLTGPGQVSYTAAQMSELDHVADPEAHYVDLQLHPKLADDLAYLQDRSLRRDAAILVRTFVLVAGRR